MSETDAVMNDETRRALRRRGRQVSMVVVGALVALVLLGVTGGVVILSMPWKFSVAVTALVAVALPIAVPYTMLRVVGLSHRDVVYVEKQAYRKAVAEAITLSGTGRTADVFTESNRDVESTESVEAATEADESAESDTGTSAQSQ